MDYKAFFAQHVWDHHHIDEDVVNIDWGRYNATTTYSWWPQQRDNMMLSFLWCNEDGATPATLTYHLEHTLFPGLNYLHLPKIAPTVRDTCKEFGIKYNGLYGYRTVLETRKAMLEASAQVSLNNQSFHITKRN